MILSTALIIAALQPTEELPRNGTGYVGVMDPDALRGYRVSPVAKAKTEELGRRWAQSGRPPLMLTSVWRSPQHPIERRKRAPGDHAHGRGIDFRAMNAASMAQLVRFIRDIDPEATIIWRAPGHYDHLHVGWSDRPFATPPPPTPEPAVAPTPSPTPAPTRVLSAYREPEGARIGLAKSAFRAVLGEGSAVRWRTGALFAGAVAGAAVAAVIAAPVVAAAGLVVGGAAVGYAIARFFTRSKGRRDSFKGAAPTIEEDLTTER